MSALFGGMSKSRDIAAIVNRLDQSDFCNESVAGHTIQSVEVQSMADSIKNLMLEHYSGALPEKYEDVLKEDAEYASRMFKNNLVEMAQLTSPTGGASINEAALMPSLVTLTASIATTMRTPYEAVLHRLFDTRTLEKQMVDIEEVIPTIKAPLDDHEEDLIDALAPYAPVPFVQRTEIMFTSLTEGIELGAKDKVLNEGMNPLYRINRDVRIDHIDVEIDGAAIPQENITIAKGSTPYFEARDNTMNCVFNVKKADGTFVTADLTAKLDFDKCVMNYLRGDPCIKKVYFYATVDHSEHTHPVQTSFQNRFSQYIVPTRPHIEVSLPNEMRTDIANSMNHFSNTDIVAAMTESITTISSRMEDQRLKLCLDSGHEYEAMFPFEAPDNFAYGNLEWFRREFVPFLDQCALKLKNDWNITDCHFRVGVSPFVLRVLDNEYSMDKSMTEESKGSGVINYSIGIKTATSVFYFISSQQFADNQLQMNLIPNNFKMSQVKTWTYFKYSSFMTDQLRRADHPVQPAIVYSERNLPIVFKPLATQIRISGMPSMSTDGTRWIKRVGA